MRICFITPYSPKEVTGVSKFVADLATTLKERNVDSTVITRLVESDVETSTQMIEIDCEITPRFKTAYLSFQTAIEVFRLRKSINILHLQTPLPQSALSALTGKILGIPVITTIHGVFPKRKNAFKNIIYGTFEKITFHFSDDVTVVSEESKDHYNLKKACFIANGVDTELYSPDTGIRKDIRNKINLDDEIVFLFVGRVTATKGIHEILEAVSALKEKEINFRLLIVGPGQEKEIDQFRQKIKRLGIEELVIMCKPRKDVKSLYCSSDVFLLPSYMEGLPLVILEAMACGLPIIASREGHIPYVIEQNVDGLLVEAKNVDDLIEKMRWCMKNRDMLDYMGKNGFTKIREHYNLQKMAEAYMNIYKTHIRDYDR